MTAGTGLAPEEAYPSLLSERWAKEGVPLRVPATNETRNNS